MNSHLSPSIGAPIPQPLSGGTATPNIPVRHLPTTPVTTVDWFRRMPTGGTFYIDPAKPTHWRARP